MSNKDKYIKYKNANNKNVNNNIIWNASKIEYNNGKIIKKNYKSTSDTMYQIASCSKFITSIIVAKLYELGKLDYDTDINNYLRKWKCPFENITLKDLLTHTSGSSDGNKYLGFNPQLLLTQNLNLNIDIISGKTYSKPFNVTEKIGSKFMYSGAGYQVIQQVIEEITNERLYILMEKYIFNKLNMKNSTGKLLYENKHNYLLADMDGLYRMFAETASSGVWMSCNDLLVLLLDIMNGYNNNTSKILQQKTIKFITKGEFPLWDKNWGLGMKVKTIDNLHLFSHTGSHYGYKMEFNCIPAKNYINIIMFVYNPKFYKNDKINVVKEAHKILM
jgi:CubicO group peptidase (beta-lactamase class C family)